MVSSHCVPDPAVSVVIPAHNEEGRITRAAGSALNDDQLPIEVVVVLDRCTDGTARVLASIGDSRIRVVANEGPPGIGGALNSGLRAARAPLIARLDADDIQEPGRLTRQRELLHARALDVCCGWARLTRPRMRPILQRTPEGSDDIRRALRRSNVIVHSTVLMDRERVLKVGGYRQTRWEDYDLWVRLSAAGARFGCVPAVVVTREFRHNGYGEQHSGVAGRIDTLALRLRAAAVNGGPPW